MTVEDSVTRAQTKLSALSHLLSQYHGDIETPDRPVHGLALMLDEIDQELAPIKTAPALC